VPTAVDHVEAALARLTTKDLETLSPAALTRLADALYAAHLHAETIAGQQAFARVKRSPRLQAPEQEANGLLADLRSPNASTD
jgi:hypothetical protein